MTKKEKDEETTKKIYLEILEEIDKMLAED